jgi:hypothetical protein
MTIFEQNLRLIDIWGKECQDAASKGQLWPSLQLVPWSNRPKLSPEKESESDLRSLTLSDKSQSNCEVA